MKITDKMLLDFIQRRGEDFFSLRSGGGLFSTSADKHGEVHKNVRKALAAAIRSERSARKGGEL